MVLYRPIPFSHCLYCIQDIDNPKVKPMIQIGCEFLLSLMGTGGLWKYWEDNNGIMEYNVPFDVDDTCLVSYLLQKNGFDIPDNEKIIYANLDSDANFNTWILPRGKNLKYPGKLPLLINELSKSRRIFQANEKIPNNEPISNYWDHEPAVSAHALLYLGETEASAPSVDKIIGDVLNGRMNLQYYDSPFYSFHHISRCFKNGLTRFEEIKDKVLVEISNADYSLIPDENYLHKVINAVTLFNFDLTDNSAYKNLTDTITNDQMHNEGWKPFKYWTSKQHSWWAGSPEMTAALYAETLSHFNKNGSVTG